MGLLQPSLHPVPSPVPPRPGPSFLCFSQTAPILTLPNSPHPPQPPPAVLFALYPPPTPSPGTETRLGGAASIFLLPRYPNPALWRQGEVSGEAPWHQQVPLASAPAALHAGLTEAEPQLFTLADVWELQHLPPFLAFAFAIPATTCGSKQALSQPPWCCPSTLSAVQRPTGPGLSTAHSRRHLGPFFHVLQHALTDFQDTCGPLGPPATGCWAGRTKRVGSKARQLGDSGVSGQPQQASAASCQVAFPRWRK